MADDWKWLIDDLRKVSPDDDRALATLCQSAAEAIERLTETVAHPKENWEWLQKAPEVPAEKVAASFVEGERMTNRLNLEEHQLSGMRVRVQSVIERARVDGGLAERKRCQGIAYSEYSAIDDDPDDYIGKEQWSNAWKQCSTRIGMKIGMGKKP
jgi:hypothetical protein